MKKILSLMMITLLVALSVVPALADNYGDTPGMGDTVDGGTLTLWKYLVTDEGAVLPDVTFSYKVTVPTATKTVGTLGVAVEGDPGTTTESYVQLQAGATYDPDVTYYIDTNGTATSQIVDQQTLDDAITNGVYIKESNTTDATVQVYVGIQPEEIKINNGNAGDPGELQFSPTDATDSIGVITDTTDPKYEAQGQSYLLEGEQYNRKEIKLDFSGITFTEPGIYRYYIQEDVPTTSETDKNLIEMDYKAQDGNETWRTIDVYVVNDNSDPANLSLAIQNYIVYEGKVEGAPREDIDYEYNDDIAVPDGGSFDPTLNIASPSVGMTENAVWTYEEEVPGNTNKDKYEYVYDKADGGWVETYTAANGDVTVKRNVTTHLQDAYGTVSTPLEVKNAGQAKAMGKTKDEITDAGTTWTAASTTPAGQEIGLVMKYVWDPDHTNETTGDPEPAWHVTGNGAGTAIAPDQTAKAIKLAADESDVPGFTYVSAGTSAVTTLTGDDNVYSNIKGTLNVADSEIQKYIWQAEVTGVTKDTFTYKYNAQTGVWDYDVVVDNYMAYDELPDAATPTPEMTANKVLYSYAQPIELEAQRKARIGYDEALQQNPNGAEATTNPKNNTFVNKMETVNLTVRKKVTGNQGSKDKYFKFTITLTPRTGVDASGLVIATDKDQGHLDLDPSVNAATDAAYYEPAAAGSTDSVIKVANSYDSDGDNTNGYTYKFGTDNKLTLDIYLQDGESLTLKGIPAGTKYTVVEADANKDGYKTTAAVTRSSGDIEFGRDELESGKTVQRKVNATTEESETVSLGGTTGITLRSGDHTVQFTNQKSGVIPTGVLMSITGGAALIAVAGVGLVVLNRRRAEDEE